MTTKPTPADKKPATKGAVPELAPEEHASPRARGYFADETERSTDTEADSFVSPDAESVEEIFDEPTDSDRDFEPVDEATDAATEADSDDTDRAGSNRHRSVRDTARPTELDAHDATELEPETTDLSQTESGGSLYPGKLQAVRAPGWDQSGGISRTDLERREVRRPDSAPMLEPASVPSLSSFHDDHRDALDNAETVAMAPLEEPGTPPTTIRRHYTAVDQAAKELARAALAAEIEKEEKQALRGYEPEEGEIPPSPEVAKRFDVILQLGKGGMAVVYLCRDPRRSGKVLAVKDIRAELKPGMKVEERVEHEAMLLKELDHPGIVKVYDFLKFQRGSAIVMEYIDGLPLDHEIGAGRRIHWNFAVRILRDIGAALHYAHGRGVIHRDIKPDNILWSERHSLMKLVDFGLARMFGDQTEIHMTRTGMVVGTPHYMSPEQVSGKVLDQRSDVYSFGATLYYLLTGQRHVEGSNVMDILEQQRSKDIIPPSHIRYDVPAWVSYIIGKMMEIKPDERYQTMQEVLDEVDRAEQDPENFVADNHRGRVKRYGGLELAPFSADTDALPSDDRPEGWPSSQSPEIGERTTNRVARTPRTTHRTSLEDDDSSDEIERPTAASTFRMPEVTEMDTAATPAQLSAMLREISVRLEQAEKRQVGPGLLVMIVLLSVLLVMLAIAGGLLLAQREGLLQQFFGW